MNRHERLLLIDKFLRNQLEGIELRRFEDLVEKNDKLRRELKLEQEIKEVINEQSDFNIFKRLVHEVASSYFNNETSSTIFQTWKVAAAIALLVSFSAIIWFYLQPLSPNQIHDRYFDPYIIQGSPRGLAEDLDEYMLGNIYYQDGDYHKAIEQFELALEKDPDSYKTLLLSGISHLALKEFSTAERYLTPLAQDSTNLLQDQARWYLGLVYLTDDDGGNDESAKGYFEKIEDRRLRNLINEINL